MSFTGIRRLVGIYAGGTVAAQLTTVASLPFLARLYAQERIADEAYVRGSRCGR